MGTQHLSLKWNSHQKNMLDVFEQLLWNEDLVDVTLACEGTTLKAHKTVLSACSSFFHNLFSEYPDKHPIVIMKDMKFSDLKIIVDFMYRGEVIVAHDQLGELLKTADTLKIKGLSESVSDGTCGSEEIFKEQEEISSNSFNTSLSLAPTSSLTSVAEQMPCQSAFPTQKRRKRIRQRKRSSSTSSDDQVSSNNILTETNFLEIIEDENTTLKSNNASSDISQSEISTFHNSVNVQNVHDIVGANSLQDPAINTDTPSHIIDSAEKSIVLDHQSSDKNLQNVPENEFIIPTIPLAEITSLQLVPSHPVVPSEITATTRILQEGNKDVKPVALMSFEEQPITFEGGVSNHESCLAMSSIKVEETPSSSPNIPCVPITQQSDQRNLQGGYGTVACDALIGEFFEEERESYLYSRPNFAYSKYQPASQQIIKTPVNTATHTKKYKQSYNQKKAKEGHHICNICHKKFSDGSNLRRHLRIHSGQRPYSCDHCGRTFIQSTGLHRHRRIHLRETQ